MDLQQRDRVEVEEVGELIMGMQELASNLREAWRKANRNDHGEKV